MRHASGPDWYAQELAALQDEMVRLYRLLEVITPIGEPHENTPAPRGVTTHRHASAIHSKPQHSRRPMLRVRDRGE